MERSLFDCGLLHYYFYSFLYIRCFSFNICHFFRFFTSFASIDFFAFVITFLNKTVYLFLFTTFFYEFVKIVVFRHWALCWKPKHQPKHPCNGYLLPFQRFTASWWWYWLTYGKRFCRIVSRRYSLLQCNFPGSRTLSYWSSFPHHPLLDHIFASPHWQPCRHHRRIVRLRVCPKHSQVPH